MKKIAIVTGATGGIGREFVRQLLAKDYDELWAVARNEAKLAELAAEYGGRVRAVPADLTAPEGLGRIESILLEEKPQVRCLVNNAGLARMAPSTDFFAGEISRTIDLNCKAPVLLCNICLPYMAKGSRILIISSASAFQPTPYINLYASTKAFERSYSRALNAELAETGITVTAVCPGWVDTELLETEMNGRKVRFPGIVSAKKVVKKAVKDAERGRDMSVCSLYVKCQHLNVKLLPQRSVMKMWLKGIRKYID